MSHPNNNINVGACDVNNHQAYGFHGDDTNYDYLYRSEDEAAYREFYGLDDDDSYQYHFGFNGNNAQNWNNENNVDGAALNAALQVEEDEATRNERLFKQFILNFHNGNYDDDEINAALSSFSAPDDESYNNDGAPPADDNWQEERRTQAITILRNQMEMQIQMAPLDLGVLSSFQLGPDDPSFQSANDMLVENRPIQLDEMLDLWKRLGIAYSKTKQVRHTNTLQITNVEISKEVMDMLLATNLGGKIDRCIKFTNTNLCGEGIISLSKLIQNNPTVNSLHLNHNPITDINAATTLSKALKPRLLMNNLDLSNCNLGNDSNVLAAVLQSDVMMMVLDYNNISSPGAVKIAEYLEDNPPVQNLRLNNNNFTDEDASLFAQALKKNTNLRFLFLENNRFAAEGIKSLIKAVYDPTTLNSISESNHKCLLYVLPPEESTNIQSHISRIRLTNYGRIGKVLLALHSKESMLHYLDEKFPVELMPEVLAFVQKEPNRGKVRSMMYHSCGTAHLHSTPFVVLYRQAPRRGREISRNTLSENGE